MRISDWSSDLFSADLIAEPSAYADTPYVTTLGFFESGQRNLLLGSEIPITAPVRLLHGQADPDVPWQTSLRLAERLRSAEVRTILVKDGDHRLSRDQDLKLLIAKIADLTEQNGRAHL